MLKNGPISYNFLVTWKRLETKVTKSRGAKTLSGPSVPAVGVAIRRLCRQTYGLGSQSKALLAAPGPKEIGSNQNAGPYFNFVHYGQLYVVNIPQLGPIGPELSDFHCLTEFSAPINCEPYPVF